MDRINTPTATEDRKFTEGNPDQGVPATVVTADWLNDVQEELANFVLGLGLELDSEAQNQLITGLFGLPHAYTAAQRYAQVSLEIDEGAVVWDMAATPSAIIHLTEDVTSLTISNFAAGGSYDLAIVQDATGEWTCAMPAVMLWPGGSGYEVSTAALARDLIQVLGVINPNTDTVEPWATASNGYEAVE